MSRKMSLYCGVFSFCGIGESWMIGSVLSQADRTLAAAARSRISLAQRKRWAARKAKKELEKKLSVSQRQSSR
jgi:hypothetical protein